MFDFEKLEVYQKIKQTNIQVLQLLKLTGKSIAIWKINGVVLLLVLP